MFTTDTYIARVSRLDGHNHEYRLGLKIDARHTATPLVTRNFWTSFSTAATSHLNKNFPAIIMSGSTMEMYDLPPSYYVPNTTFEVLPPNSKIIEHCDTDFLLVPDRFVIGFKASDDICALIDTEQSKPGYLRLVYIENKTPAVFQTRELHNRRYITNKVPELLADLFADADRWFKAVEVTKQCNKLIFIPNSKILEVLIGQGQQ